MKDNKNSIEMVIYVSDLALYNRGVNEWIELDLMTPMKAKSKYDAIKKENEGHEFFISDTSMMYDLGINEFDNIDFILYMADIFFSNWSEEQIMVFSDLIAEADFSWEYGAKKVNDYAYMIIKTGAYESDEKAVGLLS